MRTNDVLRALRESLNLSIQGVAEGANISFRTVLRAEKGHPLNPGSRQQLCAFYGKTAEELGLVPRRRRDDASHQQQQEQEQESNKLGTLQATMQEMQVAVQNLAQEGIDMNHSRRFFIQTLGAAGVTLATSSDVLYDSSTVAQRRQSQKADISASTIKNLTQITHQYRSLHRAGYSIEDELRGHTSLIRDVLENTINDEYRRELWRIQAQTQLLARQSATSKRELGRARTWNEAAIASAQYSGDTYLLGAALGHLGHLYLTCQHNTLVARQLINEARKYTKGHPIRGWFAILLAAVEATEGNAKECKASIDQATEIVHELPEMAEADDLYYTDFNIKGVDAFAGNCLLKIGEPAKALERLTSIDINSLASNRHASIFYDIACAYAAIGDLKAAQTYAFHSIDKALETHRLYIIPRCITLAQKIQKRDPYEAHASAIVEYAQVALYQKAQAHALLR